MSPAKKKEDSAPKKQTEKKPPMDPLARRAEMIADHFNGVVSVWKLYPDENVLVVLLEDGRKYKETPKGKLSFE
jgi:hypothetical protein